jgi:hypothetical protein
MEIKKRERLAVRLPTISRGQSVIIIVVVQLLIWGVQVERKEFFYLPLFLYYVSSSIHPSLLGVLFLSIFFFVFRLFFTAPLWDQTDALLSSEDFPYRFVFLRGEYPFFFF